MVKTRKVEISLITFKNIKNFQKELNKLEKKKVRRKKKHISFPIAFDLYIRFNNVK